MILPEREAVQSWTASSFRHVLLTLAGPLSSAGIQPQDCYYAQEVPQPEPERVDTVKDQPGFSHSSLWFDF